MPFLDSIVGFINDSLKAGSLKGIQPTRYIGITTILARQKDGAASGTIEVLPAVLEQDEYKMVEPDDRFSMAIYHKVISNVYSIDKKPSYGDGYSYKATTEMMAIVYADGKKLKASAEQLEPLIIYGLPQRVTAEIKQKAVFTNYLIIPLSSNMDKISVFRQEYPNTDYFLKPYQHLLSVRYRIDASFNKDCIDLCLCGDR